MHLPIQWEGGRGEGETGLSPGREFGNERLHGNYAYL